MSELAKRSTLMPAAPAAPPSRQADLRELLAFVLAGEAYAFPLYRVREILKPPPITPVPRASRHVLGIVSVRGVITTVVDLRRLMQVEETPPNKSSRILLVDTGGEVLGALVDEVLQVYRLAEDEVELAGVVGGELSDHVLGIGRPRVRTRDGEGVAREAGRDLLILLDPQPLLARIERG
ncbi:MAG: chemotaxis protein CheW [Myxococcales bacterium]|nr:chemotaxis protein CheW [Myxococcales bacterium]